MSGKKQVEHKIVINLLIFIQFEMIFVKKELLISIYFRFYRIINWLENIEHALLGQLERVDSYLEICSDTEFLTTDFLL